MSEFNYLLNAFEQASQADNPSALDYGRKRKALLDYVAKLETSPRSENVRIVVNPDMLAALRDYTQQDADGVWCGVSRQALEEAIAILAQLPEAPK